MNILPAPNGVDDTAVIQAAEDALSPIGGYLIFPRPGYLTTGLIKRSGTIWQGPGPIGPTISLIAGTTTNAVVAGVDAYALFGSGSIAGGIGSFGFRDFYIDGGRDRGCYADGVGLYGHSFFTDALEVQNCSGHGLRTEFGPGAAPVPHHNTQSRHRGLTVHSCGLTGFLNAGPTDSDVDGANINYCLQYGYWGVGVGTAKLRAVHCGGDAVGGLGQSGVAMRLDSPLNIVSDSVLEGGRGDQIWLRSSGNMLENVYAFYNQTDGIGSGILIGDSLGQGGSVVAVSGNRMKGRVDNCVIAVVFDDDAGGNVIEITGTTGRSGAMGYYGIPGAGSRVRIKIDGAATNPTMNRDCLPLVII